MNIFKFEFRSYIGSILVWSASVFSLTLVFMMFFPAFSADAEVIDRVMANYPKELLHAMGIREGLSLSTVAGYLVMMFTFVQLIAAIQASKYGFSFLSVEERELTADFLFSKPISRRTVLIAKFSSAMLALLITNVAIGISTFASVILFSDGKDYNAGHILTTIIATFVFQMFFVSIGMVVSVLTKQIKSPLSYSMGLSFGLYILNAMRGIIGGETLGIFTPFYHFEPGYILERGTFNMEAVPISLVIIVLSVSATYCLYLKRNIHAL